VNNFVGCKIKPPTVKYRVRVSGSLWHTPAQLFAKYLPPPPGQGSPGELALLTFEVNSLSSGNKKKTIP